MICIGYKGVETYKMKKPLFTFVIEWENNIYDCEWVEEYNFEDYAPIKNAHGFVFDDNDKVCVIKLNQNENWEDLGGGIEKQDKTLEDTFIREVNEEADLDLKDLKRLAIIRIVQRNDKKNVFYAARFVARVKKINKQTLDPAEGEIPKRKFIAVKDFRKYTGWDESADLQLKSALERLR